MNRILVPVDFSDTSMNALAYAVKLFGGVSALEVTILHTYDVTSSAFRMKSMDRIMEEDAQRKMDSLLQKVRNKYPDISLHSKILHSNSVSAITSLGDSGNYDYIVMGTKGASGLKEVFIGSVAGGVISRTKAPVLVVPSDYEYHPLHEAIFAIGGTPFSDPSVVEPFRKLVKMSSCAVNVIHFFEGEKPTLEAVLSSIEDLNPSVTFAFGTGDINKRLGEYLEKDGAELLCLVRNKKGFFSRIFNESITLQQTFHTSVPLLILHE